MSRDHSRMCRRTLAYYLLVPVAILALAAVTTLVAAEGPALTVDSPSEGLHTNADTLLVNGTTEPGITVRVHAHGDTGEAWNNTTSGHDGSFEVLVDLFLGPQNVTVQAEDVGGNATNVTRRVVLDITRPDLDVWLEHLNGTRIPFIEELEAYAVRVDEIVLNGTYSDDHSDHRNLTLRIDGEPLYVFTGFPGVIYQRYPLEEGINTIFVDVTDAAGNRATIHFRVLCDTTPPALVVTAPLKGEITRNATIQVAGTTDPIIRVDVVVDASAGTRTYDTWSTDVGTFDLAVTLFEGVQALLVTATDAVGNPAVVEIPIVLDTQPHDVQMLSPEDDVTYTNVPNITVVGQTTCDCIPEHTYINDVEIEHTGVFTHTVVLDEGENLITVRTVDMAGNVWERVFTVYLDTVPPTISVRAPPGNEVLTNDPTVHFEGAVAGAISLRLVHRGIGYTPSLTRGTWEDGEWEHDLLLGPMDLEQLVTLRAVDRAGNEALRSVHVVMDLVPPVLDVDRAAFEYVNRTPFIIEGTTGEDAVRVTANGVEGEVSGGLLSVPVDLVDGENTVLVTVTDKAGNEASVTLTMHLDTEPPTCALKYPKSTDGDRVTIRGTCSQDAVRVWVNLVNATVENGSFEVEVDLPREGRNRVYVTVEDRAGNTLERTVMITREEGIPGFGLALALVMLVATAMFIGRRD